MKIKDTNSVAQTLAVSTARPIQRGEVQDRQVRQDRIESSRKEVASTSANAEQKAIIDRGGDLRAIEQAVSQGSYQPDPGRIASQILQSARLLARLRAILK